MRDDGDPDTIAIDACPRTLAPSHLAPLPALFYLCPGSHPGRTSRGTTGAGHARNRRATRSSCEELPSGARRSRFKRIQPGRPSPCRAGLAAPINAITRRAELKYAPDGTPERFVLDGSINGNDVSVRTSFVNGTAQTEGNQGTDEDLDVARVLAANARAAERRLHALRGARRPPVDASPPAPSCAPTSCRVTEIAVRVVSDQPERIQVGTSFLERAALRPDFQQSRRRSRGESDGGRRRTAHSSQRPRAGH